MLETLNINYNVDAKMSNQSYSYTSSSSSYYSSSDGQGTRSYTEETYTDPSGTQRRTISKEPGQPVVQETSSYGPDGRRQVQGGTTSGQGRIEDVTDREESEADKRYTENIEDEYAKHEGGA
ncbi:MAG: hypothetical protein MMC23_009754 [Stictis urceolatum]|nr:hypothetical protein [Stictis urceolata]